MHICAEREREKGTHTHKGTHTNIHNKEINREINK